MDMVPDFNNPGRDRNKSFSQLSMGGVTPVLQERYLAAFSEDPDLNLATKMAGKDQGWEDLENQFRDAPGGGGGCGGGAGPRP